MAQVRLFSDEAFGHDTIAAGIQRDAKLILLRDRTPSGTKRSGTVIDIAMAVWIVRIGCARRYVAENHRAAMIPDTFSECWNCE